MSDPLNDPVMYEMTSEQYAEQIRAAEKRGAAKALAKANDDLLNLRDTLREKRGGSHTRWALGVEDAAGDVRVLADRIESGEVTL